MPIKQPENRIWACYNHRPGGHVVAIHFEDIVRVKKVGEGTQDIKFTAKEQLEAFKKSPQTALYVLDDKGQGKLVLNEVLVYAGDAIDWKDGAAADKVLAFAHKKGVRPIPTAESTAGLYAMADCGVFPTRGEAWGLPILECLATGVPVLTGNWSGQSEYLGDDYPQELSLSGTVARALDGVWYHGNRGNWMLPDDGDLRKKLQWAYQNSRALRMTEAWKNAVAKYRLYDWDAAAEITEKAVIKCS